MTPTSCDNALRKEMSDLFRLLFVCAPSFDFTSQRFAFDAFWSERSSRRHYVKPGLDGGGECRTDHCFRI